MIEVEKKIQPTVEQKERLLEGATLIAEKKVLDNYYDTPTFEFAKKNMYLRNRDGAWELKRYLDSQSRIGIADEITDEKEILSILQAHNFETLDAFSQKDLQLLAPIVTERVKYNKQGFIIDHDRTDFGSELFEVELLVEREEDVIEAETKVLEFIAQYGLSEATLDLKPVEYLKKVKPEIYEIIKGNNEQGNEFKIK